MQIKTQVQTTCVKTTCITLTKLDIIALLLKSGDLKPATHGISYEVTCNGVEVDADAPINVVATETVVYED